ncbi:MAG: Multidrug resistance transporter, Bcr/CflA family, partial [uncultured Blastococcus sp.]
DCSPGTTDHRSTAAGPAARPGTRGPDPRLLRGDRAADDRHVPAGAAHHHPRDGDDVGRGSADPHRHPRRAGAGTARPRPALGRLRAPAAPARGHCPARAGVAAGDHRPEPRRPGRPPRAAGRRGGGRHGHRDRRRARPLRRPGGGHDAVAAVPRARCGAGPRAHHRRRDAALHLLARDLRGARGLRRGHGRGGRPPAAGDPAARATPQQWCARDAARLPRALARPRLRGARPRRRPDHGRAVQLRLGLRVRLPGRVRPGRAAVRAAVRRRRLLADRRDPAQPGAARPLVAGADPRRGHGGRGAGGWPAGRPRGHHHRRPVGRGGHPLGRAVRLRVGAAQRSRARTLPARRGRRHRRGAARRRPVRRGSPRVAGRRRARQRRGGHRHRRGGRPRAGDRHPGGRRPAVAAGRPGRLGGGRGRAL